MTKCKGPHHDFDDFMTYDFSTFTTSRLVIDLETDFCTVNPVSRSITSRENRESREVVEVVMWSFALCHNKYFILKPTFYILHSTSHILHPKS